MYFSFNKREEDFPTLAAYNDYLELIETLGEMKYLLMIIDQVIS